MIYIVKIYAKSQKTAPTCVVLSLHLNTLSFSLKVAFLIDFTFLKPYCSDTNILLIYRRWLNLLHIPCVSFSHYGQCLSLQVWSLANCKLKTEYVGHTAYLNSVTVSPDGSLCASGGKVCVLHVLFNRLLKHFGHMNLLSRVWDCRVSIVNRLQSGQAKNYGLIPGMDEILWGEANCPDWFLAHQFYLVGIICI